MQDGYVERFDQKISPCLRRSASRRQARPSLPVYDRKRITKEGDNNFPLWQRGNKGDFVNCRSSIRTFLVMQNLEEMENERFRIIEHKAKVHNS